MLVSSSAPLMRRCSSAHLRLSCACPLLLNSFAPLARSPAHLRARQCSSVPPRSSAAFIRAPANAPQHEADPAHAHSPLIPQLLLSKNRHFCHFSGGSTGSQTRENESDKPEVTEVTDFKIHAGPLDVLFRTTQKSDKSDNLFGTACVSTKTFLHPPSLFYSTPRTP